jgi:signal peptidase I
VRSVERHVDAVALLRPAFGLAAIAILVAWGIWFRPQILGGPAAYILVSGVSMEPGLRAGALVVVSHREQYEIGEVVAYRVPEGDPAAGHNVIHRIVGGSAETGFIMQGDNTEAPDLWRPRPHEIVGAAWLTMPDMAPLLLFLRSPVVLASFAAAAAVYVTLGWLWKPEPRDPVTARLGVARGVRQRTKERALRPVTARNSSRRERGPG